MLLTFTVHVSERTVVGGGSLVAHGQEGVVAPHLRPRVEPGAGEGRPASSVGCGEIKQYLSHSNLCLDKFVFPNEDSRS